MRGKVVLVSFPFDDLSGMKVRPAVCLTDPVGAHQQVVLAFITSQPPKDPLDSDMVFSPTDPDFGLTGLRIRSTLRLHRLMTRGFTMLRRELGERGPVRQREVAEALKTSGGDVTRRSPGRPRLDRLAPA